MWQIVKAEMAYTKWPVVVISALVVLVCLIPEDLIQAYQISITTIHPLILYLNFSLRKGRRRSLHRRMPVSANQILAAEWMFMMVFITIITVFMFCALLVGHPEVPLLSLVGRAFSMFGLSALYVGALMLLVRSYEWKEEGYTQKAHHHGVAITGYMFSLVWLILYFTFVETRIFTWLFSGIISLSKSQVAHILFETAPGALLTFAGGTACLAFAHYYIMVYWNRKRRIANV